MYSDTNGNGECGCVATFSFCPKQMNSMPGDQVHVENMVPPQSLPE